MKIRTVIVDDEPLARSRIVKLLREHEDVQLVGQCKNGREAVNLICKKKPELIFLDIQMPDMDGFKVIRELDLRYQPIVIFATAYDQYALKAFDVHAIDYLLKPFDKDRFKEAIDRAKAQIKLKKSSEFNHKLMNLLSEYQEQETRYLASISITEDGRELRVRADDIQWIEADGNYLVLNLESKNFLYRSTLNSLEAQLDPEQFLRMHRSFLVNLIYVKNVRYQNNNEYRFTLQNGRQLVSGRSYKDRIAVKLNDRELL